LKDDDFNIRTSLDNGLDFYDMKDKQ